MIIGEGSNTEWDVPTIKCPSGHEHELNEVLVLVKDEAGNIVNICLCCKEDGAVASLLEVGETEVKEG